MRILHLTNHCEESGNGIVNVAVDLACLQAAEGHSVAYASAGGSYIELLNQYAVKHFTMQTYGTTDMTLPRILRHPAIFARAFRDLHRIVVDFRPDIIHAHMIAGAIVARIVTTGHPTRAITTVHNVFDVKSALMAVGHRVICVSDSVKQTMLRRGIPERKLRVVVNGPLGSPRQPSEAVDPSHAPITSPSIVIVAGLYQRKGIDDLISAVEAASKAVPGVSLHILGEGPARHELELKVRDAGMRDHVHFHGFVRDPRPYLRAADIFVLASRRESFGLAIVEARQAGCAVIASNVDGIPEALDNGEAGILTPPQRPDLLAKELIRLLQNRDELDHWRSRAGGNLDWLHCSRVARDTLDVYRDALGLKRARPDLVQLHVPR